MRIKIHQAAFASQAVVPAILQMRNLRRGKHKFSTPPVYLPSLIKSTYLHVITNALHMTSCVGGLRSKDCSHTNVQQSTNCKELCKMEDVDLTPCNWPTLALTFKISQHIQRELKFFSSEIDFQLMRFCCLFPISIPNCNLNPSLKA